MKEKILIDLDDTITTGTMEQLCKDFLGYEIDKDSLIPGQYINQQITSPYFVDFFLKHNLYDYDGTDQYVINCIKELDKKYDIYIASVYHYPNMPEVSSIMIKRKLEHLKKYFGFLGEKKFLLVGDKSILNFDISIGDSLNDQIGKKRNFLITRYHNKHLSEELLNNYNSIRVESWHDIMKILSK